MNRWRILFLTACFAGSGLLGLEVAGQAESSITLSEKAMAHLRAPSDNMPNEINREISAYNAVTTLASMFGVRDLLLSGYCKTVAESEQREIERAVFRSSGDAAARPQNRARDIVPGDTPGGLIKDTCILATPRLAQIPKIHGLWDPSFVSSNRQETVWVIMENAAMTVMSYAEMRETWPSTFIRYTAMGRKPDMSWAQEEVQDLKHRGQIIVFLTTGPAAASWAEEDWQSEAEAYNRYYRDRKDRIHSLGPAPEIKSEDLPGPRQRMEFKRKRYGGDRFEGELKILWNNRRLEKYAEAVIGERTAHGFWGSSLERVVGGEQVSSIEARVKGVNPPLVMSIQAFGNDAEPVHEGLVESIIDIILGAALEASGTSSDCGKAGALTRHLEALRTQHRNIQTLDGELEWLLNTPSPDSRQVVEYGRKAERIAAEYHTVFRDFKRAETRRGMVEELDLLVETPLLLNEVVLKYQHLAQVPITPLKPEDLVRSRDERSRTIIKLARDHFASRLESEGLRDILTSDSWEEAVEKTAGHARRKVEEFIDGETERIFGFGFHDVESARRALQLQLRREIRRQVAKLLIQVTSNQIVIEIVAGPVIRWIERDLIPRLKEALRQKGNLPNRVTRSVETIENARRALNALPCDARLRDVRSRLASARGTIHASRFLDKDLRAAGAGEELARLEAADKDLRRTISLAERRFLLNKDDYEDDLVLIDEVIVALRDILKRSIPSGTDVRPPAERKPPVQKVDPPVRLRHEERAETATFASHSPALKALRFYEAGMEGVADGFRDYRATFPKAASRLIWWELHFEYPAPGRRIDFSVEAVYTAPDGREMNRNTTAFNFQPEWTASKHTNGFGYRDRGGWQPGIYRVELFVDGAKIAEGKFYIIE